MKIFPMGKVFPSCPVEFAAVECANSKFCTAPRDGDRIMSLRDCSQSVSATKKRVEGGGPGGGGYILKMLTDAENGG